MERYKNKSKIEEASSADNTYKAHSKEIASLMKDLQKLLKDHAKQQSKEPLNWGYTGDLGYLVVQMRELVQFLSNQE